MPQPDLPKAIRLTKNEGALLQVVGAMEMYLAGRYECAITLAGAAEDMLPPTSFSLHRHHLTRSVPPELSHTSYAKLDAKGRNTFWNEPRDWLKHKTPNLPDAMTLNRYDAESMIARALSHLPHQPLTPVQEETFRAFFASYMPDGRPRPSS